MEIRKYTVKKMIKNEFYWLEFKVSFLFSIYIINKIKNIKMSTLKVPSKGSPFMNSFTDRIETGIEKSLSLIEETELTNDDLCEISK